MVTKMQERDDGQKVADVEAVRSGIKADINCTSRRWKMLTEPTPKGDSAVAIVKVFI